MRPLRFLLRKEFLQILRDHTILRMLFVMPVVQLLVLANAATFEVREARMYVVDHDRSAASRGVADRLAASGRFVAVAASPSVALADDAMLDRRADLILVVPSGFERDLVRDRRAAVQLVLNAEDGSAAAVTRSYATEVLASYAAELGAELAPALATIDARPDLPPRPGQPVVEVRRRGWYNAELDYRDYMVPGILVQLVTIVGTMLTAMNIVREKEAGTLDQLNVTPVGRPTFIAAKLIPLWSLALVELSLGLAVARFVFDVPMEGSLALVFLGAGIYLVAALGIGLWVSTVAETQQQAMFVTFFIMMIYLLMSGLFTPVRAMPEWAQWIAQLNPMKHFIELMRGVLLKGAGLADVARELAALVAFGVVVLTLAVRQYDKRAA
ncbi:MAG TPA: ABC transporter permease [Gemmatimonadaceae bacterium]